MLQCELESKLLYKGLIGIVSGTIRGVLKGDTSSLDHGSCDGLYPGFWQTRLLNKKN